MYKSIDLYELFPTTIYIFKMENDEICNDVFSFLNEYKFFKEEKTWEEEVLQTDNNLHLLNETKTLMSFFESCLFSIKNMNDLQTEKIKITLCWANKSTHNSKHQNHYHPNSLYSGIFYVTSGGAKTIFYDPVNYRNEAMIKVFGSSTEPKPNTVEIIPEKGTLVIFPSWFRHSTENHDSDECRWSVSFNTLPYGKTNSQPNVSLASMNLSF